MQTHKLTASTAHQVSDSYSATSLSKLESIEDKRAFALQTIKKYIPNWRNIKVNTSDPTAVHFIGMSGGVDSSTLGVCCALLFPEIKWIGLFTDTGDEPKEVSELLDWIEELTEMKIVRLHDKDLYEEIEKNGYLPSPLQRWCTAKLKLKPFDNYIKENFLVTEKDTRRPVYAYSGLRFDERDRVGAIGLDGVTTVHPFIAKDVAVERSAVCSIASDLLLLSGTYYRGRSRSGCESCMFQSKQEWVSLLIWNSRKFLKAASVEKMPADVLTRLEVDDGFCVRNPGFYTLYPMSSIVMNKKSSLEVVDVFSNTHRVDDVGKITWDYEPLVSKKATRCHRSKKIRETTEDQLDMFGLPELSELETEVRDERVSQVVEEQETVLYVAFEHYKSDMMGMFCSDDELNGVWQSRLVTYSTSQGGLTRSLHGYYYHRAMASNFAWDSLEHYDNESHITVVVMRFPKGIIPKINYSAIEGSRFGWSQNQCLAEIAHTVAWINRACDIYQCKAIVAKAQRLGRRTKLVADCMETLNRYQSGGSPEIGTIVGVGHYRPKPIVQRTLDDSYDEDVQTVRCFACSI
ncbi:hypothetical protein L1D14_07720 [Vibrio tubiashii]|uniref:hypothetical protein n=1 Tax=Vibrio tubiashii TaxID=29498 RepID=UPI001EFC862F|nr:hypothetical protein [Vibrio tubiashii]MCG9576127.1 hypothetical protein [Vibrio tubiashii]